MNNLSPTTEMPSVLEKLPKSQREYTPEQREPRAITNPEILADLSAMYDIESDAISFREFGEY